MINFVIPSVGRPTLKNTLQSLVDQTNSNWECWVGFDGLSESDVDKNILLDDPRIHYIYIKDKMGSFSSHNIGNAGLVRNFIISNILGNNYEWIGFVDDDDTLKPYYVEKLLEECNCNYTSFDCCIFRMKSGDSIIPPIGMTEVIQNFVGISFCVKKQFVETKDVKFINSTCEDYTFLETIHKKGGIIYMSEHITYNVRN